MSMMKLSLLIMTLAVAATAWMVQNDGCLPDCTGKTAGDYVPDPLNCTNFYICLADNMPTNHAVPCPAGEIFNPETLLCEAGLNCVPVCQPPNCHITCNGSFSLISDPFNCGVYHICIAGQVTATVHCEADNPFFNGENCVNDKDVCCTVSCVPYCQPGIVQAPDPTDCTKYYICVEEGPVDSSLHFPCDSGQYFDYQTGRCLSGTSCTNLCSGEQSTTTTTTTTTPHTVPPSTDCVESLTCEGSGNFAKCSSCQQEYFHCTAGGAQGILSKCSENLVFNPDPDYPFCILPSTCPYHPN
nr:uncharacterized protein LOC123759616 [Procambarus clarkii]